MEQRKGPRAEPVEAPTASPRARIVERALALGFDAIGFAPAHLGPEAGDRLRAFLAAGHHGSMGWMADTADRRAHPRAMWPEARTAICLAVNYGPDHDPLESLAHPDRATVSCYAKGRDYHDLIKGRLKQLAGFVAGKLGAEVKVFVDTAPLMEKPLARAAGLGWQGKHTNLVSRTFGSWTFLGEILTDLDLPADAPETDHCGTCRACLDACPTDAFPAPYRLDARRCVSYLTIEHAGPVDEDLRPKLGNRIYGCDDCLAVCPWNKFARAHAEPAFAPRAALTAPRLADLAALDDAGFRQAFAGSPVKRIGRNRFVRNVLYAIGNSGAPALAPVAAGLADDPDPVVADAARWAAARLALAPRHG